jgi:hypothetical protein
MILQTGGSALATISTRSRSASSAARNASAMKQYLFALHLQQQDVLLSHGSHHLMQDGYF